MIYSTESNTTLLSMRAYQNLLVAFLFTIVCSFPASAQNYPNQRYPDQGYQGGNGSYVTVYEDCDFRGRSRALAVGDYFDVRDLNIGNDKISSMHVPPGLELTLYEHERLRGKSVTISQDVSCLNREWNDETSSMRVVQGNRSQTYGGRYSDNDRGYQNDGYNQGGYGSDRNLTAGISRVKFANATLVQRSRNQWEIRNKNGDIELFREVNRDGSTIFLRNQYSSQQVLIQLNSNNVRFISPNGQVANYRIKRADQGSSNRNVANNRNNSNSSGPNRNIQGQCFTYKAYTRGGEGGVRFHGHEGFHRFGKSGHSGRICHNGALTMEMSKTNRSTDLIVEIQNKRFRFATNEKHDAYLNTWYRKKVRLNVN